VFNRRSHAQRRAGFPHSEILGSTSGYRLPQAYRRFPRPSSAPVAKASTMRPEKLSHTTAKPSMSKNPHHDTGPSARKDRHHVRASKMTTFSAPPHHARGRDHGGNKNKMLASTMQFPNNNPHHTPTPPARATLRCGRNQDFRGLHGPTRNNHRHKKAQTLPHGGRSCCPRTQQCANTPTPIRTRRLRVPLPWRDTPVHGPGRPFQGRYYGNHRPVRPGAPFVDVPPLSSPPAHTRDRNGQPMDHPGTPEPGPGR
jgi:hypothetical protein